MMSEKLFELSTFCENVRLIRKEHGLTQREMVKIMGIGVGSFRKVEQGVIPPRLDVSVLICLSDYFGISCDSLFCSREKQDFT